MTFNTHLSRTRIPAAVGLITVLLCGCSTIDQTASNVFSSNADASGVFAGRVLLGKANFTTAREGTVHLQSDEAPSLNCFGNLRFTATTSGVVGFSCSDGSSPAIPFQALSPLRGSGRTQVGSNVFALTYGLQPEMAAAYLAVPVERLPRPKPDVPGKNVTE